MILISHRGNMTGPNPKRENSPDYIAEASQQYDVEVDVWIISNQFYLGHDAPIYQVREEFLQNPKFWCHAKNLAALEAMLKNNIHCFWHQTDDVVLTSKGYLWTFPGKELAKEKSIAVMPERVSDWDVLGATGVCSDVVGKYS